MHERPAFLGREPRGSRFGIDSVACGVLLQPEQRLVPADTDRAGPVLLPEFIRHMRQVFEPQDVGSIGVSDNSTVTQLTCPCMPR
jgi:hypothetical protein